MGKIETLARAACMARVNKQGKLYSQIKERLWTALDSSADRAADEALCYKVAETFGFYAI